MKNILLLLIFSTMIFLTGNAQWVEQVSGTSEQLNEVHFVSATTGYIVGDNGTILKTIDGGTNWLPLTTPNNTSFNAVFFIDDQKGFVGSETDEILLKTENGGNSWQTIDLNLSSIYDIYFINEQVGFIGGEELILRTEDGGQTWNEVSINATTTIHFVYEIHAASPTVLYAAVSSGIIKSEDAGINWTQVKDDSSPDYNAANILTSCFATSTEKVFFGSYYYWGLYNTNDGANTLNYREMVIRALDFSSSDSGYAIEGFEGKNIMQTTDAGSGWNNIHTSNNQLNDLTVFGENLSWIVGRNGTILHQNSEVVNTNDLNKLDHSIRVSPNPFQSTIRITSELNSKIKEIALFNLVGTKLMHLNKYEDELNVSMLHAGVYFLNLSLENGHTVSKKIIKSK